MNREQSKILDLMKEFSAICSSNDIQYYLAGESLLYGVCKGTVAPHPCYASVFMTTDNGLKFINAFNSSAHENRAIEYWGNSPEYPDFTIRYIATDTTAFNLFDYVNYKNHGMFVEIQLLRGNNRKNKTRSNNALEKAALINSSRQNTDTNTAKTRKESLYTGYYKTLSTVMGKSRIKKQLFDYYVKECGKPQVKEKGIGGVYQFTVNGKVIKDISEYYFTKPDTCEVEGYTFPIPRSSKVLLRKIFGTRIGKNNTVTDNNDYADNSIIDVNTPFEETFRNLNIDKDYCKNLYELKKRIDEINKQNSANNKIAREDWNTVKQTGERFRMWKIYAPRKEKIIKLYEEGRFDDLKEEFYEYSESLEEMKAIKRSFSFDPELFDIYIHMLEHQGHFKEANRIISLLPKSHYNEIKIEK